jgi:hypothetical protein
VRSAQVERPAACAPATAAAHHDDTVVHQVVRRVIRLHEVHAVQLGHLLDLLQCAPQADHAWMELCYIRFDELRGIALRVDRDEDGLHADAEALLCMGRGGLRREGVARACYAPTSFLWFT